MLKIQLLRNSIDLIKMVKMDSKASKLAADWNIWKEGSKNSCILNIMYMFEAANDEISCLIFLRLQ